MLGRQAGCPRSALASGIAALLHEIGSLDQLVDLRNSARTRIEEAIYQSHCRVGYEAAQRSGRLSPAVLDAILHHHERIDGSGYPDRLVDKEIQVAARVVAIANRFDNLANPIDPRRALSPSEALATMWSKEKAAFDTVLLQLFVRAMGVYPPGSIVQLSDGRVGAVVASASTDRQTKQKNIK